MWTPDKSSCDIPAPDPKKPWALSVNDRLLCKRFGILVEPDTPYPPKRKWDNDEGD